MKVRIVFAAVLTLIGLTGCNGEFPVSSAQLDQAEGAYDMMQLNRNLKGIKAWHIEYATGLANSLRIGATVESIDAAFSSEACRPNDELKALWSWHNGEDSPVPFVWYHDFLSMEEARSEYDWLLLNPLINWDPNFIPVFSFESEWYAVYCGAGNEVSGPVVHFFLEDEPRVTYINLTTFASTMAEVLRSGAVTWKNGAMVDDIGQVYRNHQKHNSGYEFPYYVPEGS